MEKGTRVYRNGETGTVQGTHTDGSILVQWDGDGYKTYGYTAGDLLTVPTPQYRDLL